MSNFFLSPSSSVNTDEKSLGDKLVYYGEIVATLGSIVAVVGSTILYYQDIEEETAFEENAPVTNRQLIEMQQQITLLQQKIDQMEHQGQ
ncbi:hypothetical protein [Oceanobacillus locisalsi]|uniref:Uncharacterized protein n=1 Tax=Oceanobacillus locisalsi TaxID=546107 RepID=A0ABW3NH54_9BACI